MKEIILKSRKHGNKICLVDDEDYEWLQNCRWNVVKDSQTYYAIDSERAIRMHREVMKHAGHDIAGSMVDHKDGNGLNNQKENLRVCNNSQNQQNRHNSFGTSKYKGVRKVNRKKKPWRVDIRVNGIKKFIGYFSIEIEAAKAYNEAAIKYYGEFAKLNEIEE